MPAMSPTQKSALDYLIAIAKRDTGQSRRVANFLLAWWNAPSCGGFDLTDLWPVDPEIQQAMLQVIGLIIENHGRYPDAYGYAYDFEELVKTWRPKLIEDQPR